MWVLVCWTGDSADGERALAPLRALATPLADTVGPMPYPAIEAYMQEPVRYGALHITNLHEEGAQVADAYRNMVNIRFNTNCLRLAVFDAPYRWHYHPTSDELFIVVDGCLVIDLAGGRELQLAPWDCVAIPAMTVHRTRDRADRQSVR